LSRRIRLLSIDDVPEPRTPDGGSSLAERDALRLSLVGLTPDQRTVVVLRYFSDLSLEEIAERTGERLGTVKSRLHYALEALHAAYDAADRLAGGTIR
jgi:RNA polymerase sigma-70 factor (ECF subfamily)